MNAKFPTKESLVLASVIILNIMFTNAKVKLIWFKQTYFQNLLNDRPLKECYIGMSFLIQKYLQNTQDYDSFEVTKSLENLGVPLKKAFDTSSSSDDEDLVITSLKALGNVKYINNDLENLIAQIIKDASVTQRIRAAALNMIKVYAKSPQVCKNINCEQFGFIDFDSLTM